MLGAGLIIGVGRRLKGLFAEDAARATLSFSDASLLELFDLTLLRREAREADISAGRVGARDRPQRLRDAAIVWRELARRTGDAVALRKSASAAELAWAGFEKEGRAEAAGR